MSSNIPSTLELLEQASNDDLQPLVNYLTQEASLTEGLSQTNAFKHHHPNHSKYAKEIYEEVCLFGGNTIANIYRGGEGPSYSKILSEVAAKIGVKGTKNLSIIATEEQILENILRQAIKKDSGKQKEALEEILKQAGLSHKDYSAFISGSSLVGLIAGREILAKVSIIIANTVAKQLLQKGIITAGGNVIAGRLGSTLLGPIGWVISGLWTAVDIAGPAFRVTIPCTLHIAMLRLNWICKQETRQMEGAFDD